MTALTPEQRAAVARREGDLHLTAAAGSGKTRVLTERFVAAVTEDGVDPRRILAITFTEKAAGELAERIRDRLRDAGREEDARAAESGWIGTIHGWAARLLRTHPLQAGLDPRFTVSDEVAAERTERAAWDTALAAWVRDGGEPAEELLAAYGAPRLRDAVRGAHAELRARGRPVALPAPPATAGAPAVRAAADALRGALQEVHAEVPAPPERAALALEGCGALLAEALDPIPPHHRLAVLVLPKGNGNGLKGPACDAYRETVEGFVQACVDARAAAAVPRLDALVRGFAAAYAEVKAARGALDFADLELRARDLLRAHPALRERWRERFVLVMVDEFQDTNPLQLELLELIAADNLFTVGDPWQAIYGFRHADVRGLAERATRLGPARTLGLTENFRSRPEVVAPLNRAFGSVLGPSFTPLEPAREPAADGVPHIELLLTDSDGWEGEALVPPGALPPAQAWRLAEARLLAQEIARRCDAGRPAGEIVVLLRATGDISLYARALEDAGVPTYLVGGHGFWARREVQDLVAWLSVLANPRDELRLLEVLASPLVGVGADALVALSAADRDAWWALREPAPDSPLGLLADDDRRRLAAFAAFAAAERAERGGRPLATLIERALEHTGYDLHLLRLPGGPRRLANVRKLVRLAREWEQAEGRDLRGFLDSLALRAGEDAAEAREGEAPVEGEDLGAVRLMTIHRAKGLEFEVVCVADLGRQRFADEAEVLRLGDGDALGLRIAVPGGGKARAALAYRALGEQRRRRDEDEEKRLFYVAATRAREELVLSGAVRLDRWPSPTSPTAPPVSWLAPAFVPGIEARVDAGERRGEQDGVRWAVSRPGEEAVLDPHRRAPTPAVPAAPAAVAAPAPPAPATAPPPPLPAALSFSALEAYAACGYRFHAERGLNLPPSPPARTDAEPGDALPGTLRGTLVHALLEEVAYRAPLRFDPARLDALAGLHGVRLTPAQRLELADLVAALTRSPVFPRLAAARRAAREERFAFVHDGLLVDGVLDVLVREGRRALVVDFKTNVLRGRTPAEIVETGYTLQRAVYALALLRAGAEEVEVAFVFLEDPEATVARTFTAADGAALEAHLRTHTAPLARGELSVALVPGPELCAGCPVRGTLCSHPYAATLTG